MHRWMIGKQIGRQVSRQTEESKNRQFHLRKSQRNCMKGQVIEQETSYWRVSTQSNTPESRLTQWFSDWMPVLLSEHLYHLTTTWTNKKSSWRLCSLSKFLFVSKILSEIIRKIYNINFFNMWTLKPGSPKSCLYYTTFCMYLLTQFLLLYSLKQNTLL